MRRTVATLLVVASPLLVAVPVGAAEGPSPARAVPAPAMAPPAAVPVAAVPAAPVTVAPPAVPAPSVAAAVERVGAPAAAPVHPVARTPWRATLPAGNIDDAAYAARLQADLCQARTIFCGLDRGGRYPAH